MCASNAMTREVRGHAGGFLVNVLFLELEPTRSLITRGIRVGSHGCECRLRIMNCDFYQSFKPQLWVICHCTSLGMFAVELDEFTEPFSKRFQQQSPSIVLRETELRSTAGKVYGKDMPSDEAAISAKKKIELFERKQHEVRFCHLK